MYRRQVSFEDIRAIEALLGCASAAWAEATHHSTLVMRQSMSVLVVLACEAFDMVLACCNWAFLWSLILMRKHVRLEIFHVASTCRDGTQAFVRLFRYRRGLAVSRVDR